MIEALKKAANWILVGLLGLLGLMFGIEKWRRKKTEEKLDRTEEKLETVVVEKDGVEKAIESTDETVAEIAEIERREDESKDDSYNDLVDAWNSDRL